MSMSSAAKARAVREVASIYLAIRAESSGPVGMVFEAKEVADRLSGLLFALHQIGLMLTLAGGMPLRASVVAAVEEALDDVTAAAFIIHRWEDLGQ